MVESILHTQLSRAIDYQITGKPNDLAYVIFTSGSTGRPKGVEIVQRGVVKMILHKASLLLAKCSTVLQFSDVAFDGSVFDYLPTLCCGHTLVLWNGTMADAEKACWQHEVEMAFFTDSALQMLNRMPSCTRVMGQAGEALSMGSVGRWAPTAPRSRS